ncbi:hypothetical protein TNCV_750211 [Trichonephila clavipes]|nr:hypothetical protein TNCV_750211 [Trichonephila clavipes]
MVNFRPRNNSLISRVGERHTDLNGLLQYLHNGMSNVLGIDFVTVPSAIKYRKLIGDLLERLDASNPTALLTAYATRSSIFNEVTLEIDLHFDSIVETMCTQQSSSVTEELDKVIKDKYAPMQPIKFETLSSKIQKEMSLFENGWRHGDYIPGKNIYLFNDDKAN